MPPFLSCTLPAVCLPLLNLICPPPLQINALKTEICGPDPSQNQIMTSPAPNDSGCMPHTAAIPNTVTPVPRPSFMHQQMHAPSSAQHHSAMRASMQQSSSAHTNQQQQQQQRGSVSAQKSPLTASHTPQTQHPAFLFNTAGVCVFACEALSAAFSLCFKQAH